MGKHDSKEIGERVSPKILVIFKMFVSGKRRQYILKNVILVKVIP